MTLLKNAYISVYSLTLSEENVIIVIVSQKGFLITKESSKLHISFFMYLTNLCHARLEHLFCLWTRNTGERKLFRKERNILDSGKNTLRNEWHNFFISKCNYERIFFSVSSNNVKKNTHKRERNDVIISRQKLSWSSQQAFKNVTGKL